MARTFTSREEVLDVHAFKDSTNRHPVDALIRSHGWQIHSRQKHREPIWTRPDGVTLPQSQVLSTLPKEDVERVMSR
jgi:hypothetical protein